jgi:hypothetical protein
MKKYRYVGIKEDADNYLASKPEIGKIYNEDDYIGGKEVKYWVDCKPIHDEECIADEWEEVVKESSKAMRFNSDKPKYSLLDLKAMEPGVKVLEFGAKKYAPNNWKKGMPMSEILDSMMRHIAAIQSGEMVDPESGLSHIGHIQCNALFLGGPNVENDMTNA